MGQSAELGCQRTRAETRKEKVECGIRLLRSALKDAETLLAELSDEDAAESSAAAASAKFGVHHHTKIATKLFRDELVLPSHSNYVCDGCRRKVEGILSSDAPLCNRHGIFCPNCTDDHTRPGGKSVADDAAYKVGG